MNRQRSVIQFFNLKKISKFIIILIELNIKIKFKHVIFLFFLIYKVFILIYVNK